MAQPDNHQSVTLRDYVRVVWLRKWLVVIVVVACTAAAFFAANLQTRVYTATALLMYQPAPDIANPLSGNSPTDINSLALQVQSVVNTINSPDVGNRAGETLRRDAPQARDFKVSATILPPDSSAGSTVSDVVAVSADSPRPTVSAAVANAYTLAIMALRVESEQARLRAAQDAISTQMKVFASNEARLSTDYLLLAQRLRDLQVAEATATGDFKVIQPATPPATPSSPKPLQSAAVGLAVGLFAGIALAFLVGQFDNRVRDHREVAKVLGLPIVGRLPRISRRTLQEGTLVTLTEPDGAVAESLRILRSNLDWARIDADWRSMLITSGQKGEGKTLTLCNLAISLTAAGKRVAIVDADLRAPRVHTAFSLPNGFGLSSVIQGSMKLSEAMRPFGADRPSPPRIRVQASGTQTPARSNGGTLMVLTSGPLPPNPGEVVASQRMAAILRELADSDFDYVLVDAPPLLAVGDAGALASSVDSLLYVANIEGARRPTLRDGREALDTFPCRKLGVVVVGERLDSPGYYHYGSETSSNG